jgi:type I restriction enzyme M protein
MNNNMNINKEVSMVWSIANKLRGAYKSDKYKDVIIPMVIIRRFECALAKTKDKVVETYNNDKTTPEKILCKLSGYSFYNTSKFDLKELLNDSEHIAANFKSYINGFSPNVKTILLKDGLDFEPDIDKMAKNNRLLGVIKEFSILNLNPETVDNHKMGYIFEDIIRRFSENAEAGDHFTPREVIRLMVKILLSEGCDDLATPGKTITILDAACGTGGMLSTARESIMELNPNADVELFGQEVNPESYGICLADMLIKGQDAKNIRFQDTMKADCFSATLNDREQKMRFVIMNPPFGQPWGGKDAADGVEAAVKKEYELGFKGRFGAGLPGTGDMQLLFMQHAISKLDENGRAAIITNGSPLFSGGTTSGESQIRRWMIENDLIEAIIALPTDLFYNTGIGIYVFILSKQDVKLPKRRGKIQLINAVDEEFWTQLRTSLGKKRKEISPSQINKIVDLYTEFKENKYCKIFDKEEFLYREYSIYQPMQRSYAINDERIENLRNNGYLDNFYNQDKVDEYQLLDPIPTKEKKELDKYLNNKETYDLIFDVLEKNKSEKVYKNEKSFVEYIKTIFDLPKNILDKVVDGLSVMDKTAEIQKDKNGNIIKDNSTKDIEIVKYTKDIDEYMSEEVVPHIPDAMQFFEEDMNAKKPVIKTGAEFPFTRYFYEYKEPESSEKLEKEFLEIESSLNKRIEDLFKEV